jgi:predicted AAA+ superfamily ATPase
MQKLLKLIALQIGSEISYDELSKQLGLSRNTVEKYLDLLSKTFVIFKLPAFSANPRKEISKMAKWFFYDNGIRNALINDFKPIVIRKDVGMLWENFIISERIKKNNNLRLHKNYYFWRNYNKQEVDFIEEYNGELHAFECKWNECNLKIPSAFKDNYPKTSYNIIHNRNFFNFL